MSEMGSHEPFGHLQHKLCQKERPGIKLSVWVPTSKVGNRPDLGACRWSATHRWKDLDESYKFAWKLIPIGGLIKKLWPREVAGVPTIGILGLPFGSPDTKGHLDVALMESYKVYYMGEGGGFPWVRAMVSLVSPSCP
jgi:hypothetical protein